MRSAKSGLAGRPAAGKVADTGRGCGGAGSGGPGPAGRVWRVGSGGSGLAGHGGSRLPVAGRYTTASSPRSRATSRALGFTDGRKGTSHTRARSGLPGLLAYSSGSQTVSSVPTPLIPTGT